MYFIVSELDSCLIHVAKDPLLGHIFASYFPVNEF